jgi:hypothetical protein
MNECMYISSSHWVYWLQRVKTQGLDAGVSNWNSKWAKNLIVKAGRTSCYVTEWVNDLIETNTSLRALHTVNDKMKIYNINYT